jgi:hypothetical protein
MPSSIMYAWFDKHGTLEQGSATHLKIHGFFKVDTSNISYITRLLANGFPLLGSLRVGKLFEFLGAGQPCTALVSGDDFGLLY